MRRLGNFFLTVGFNAVLNFAGTIPAWILLVLHFTIDLPLWLFWAALGLFLLGITVKTLVFSLLTRAGNAPEPRQENKNPYSKK